MEYKQLDEVLLDWNMPDNEKKQALMKYVSKHAPRLAYTPEYLKQKLGKGSTYYKIAMYASGSVPDEVAKDRFWKASTFERELIRLFNPDAYETMSQRSARRH